MRERLHIELIGERTSSSLRCLQAAFICKSKDHISETLPHGQSPCYSFRILASCWETKISANMRSYNVFYVINYCHKLRDFRQLTDLVNYYRCFRAYLTENVKGPFCDVLFCCSIALRKFATLRWNNKTRSYSKRALLSVPETVTIFSVPNQCF